ncbi:hypothetical protein GV828_01205 [Flavobacterium sp. NST-5]|uniref:Uncharacterized protein n=1 Tax=Flavobacterium ichthyis TaxID=2698827 RepID=A0ABW9Z535_9FLAO|nr:hypothetical protein [Flavobacterium ichthyis]NBL63811.1 hypothetical protein [Flavobacterium ichthyis]
MRKILFFTVSVFFLAFYDGNAQEVDNKKQAIAKAIEDYFFLERENIHVQFSKEVYLTNEKIWFKGYVYHRKNNLPFYNTTNVYAVFMTKMEEK